MNNDYILLAMMLVLWVGAVAYGSYQNEKEFKKAHNKNKKKKFWI